MKQTHHIGYVQTPSVKNLSNVKNALVENGLVPLTTPNEMLPDAIVEGLKKLEIHDYGMIHEGKYRIRYFDIDGKILKIEYVEEGGKLNPPAKTPNYDPDYLIFDEWNYDIENYVVEQPTDVGAIYKTVDDATYMFCRFTNQTGLNPTLAISGFTSIDWGDGTVNTSKSHTYAEEGIYLIKIYGNITFQVSQYTYLLGSANLNSALIKIYVSNNITNNTANYNYTFQSCVSLKVISLPKKWRGAGIYLCKDDVGLKHINMPKESTTTNNSPFYGTGIETISLPNLFNAELNYFISGGQSDTKTLKEIIFPIGTTKLGNYSLQYQISLENLCIPKNLTNIGSGAFTNLKGLRNVFIFSKNIITFSSTTELEKATNKSLIFWVKDNFIEQLKVATGWSTVASQLKPLSWYPSLTDPNAE